MKISVMTGLALALPWMALGETVEPFSVTAKNAPKPVKIVHLTPYQKALACFGAANAGNWAIGGLGTSAAAKAFALEQSDGKDAIHLFTDKLEAGQSIVAYRLTDDEAKGLPNYVSFLCKSTKDPVRLTFSLLANKALDGAGVKVVIPVNPGGWQRVIIPISQFGAKGTPKIQAIGLGVDRAAKGSDVYVADLSLGAAPVTADDLKVKRTVISLNGLWKFSTDPGNSGVANKWNAAEFDDSSWKTLKSAVAWTDQGIVFAGWGWYRQQVIVPQEAAGAPLTLVLAEIPFEDEVFFNGVKVGGLVGNYPYHNLLPRMYSVPASLVHYGQPNTVAVRTWGVDGGSSGSSKSGLVPGMDPKATYYQAEFDPFATRLRMPGKADQEVGPDQFDLSAAQQGMPFEVVFRFPADALKDGSGTLFYTLTDFYKEVIAIGQAPVTVKDGVAQAVVAIDDKTSQTIYQRGRFKAYLTVCDAAGAPVISDVRLLDRFSFAQRDVKELPPLAETIEDTPYGKLKLVDEIDCSVPESKDQHPYMAGGFDHAQDANTPGSESKTVVTEILGKKARDSSAGMGFFAYRIGRGKMQPHKNYLLRVEYPEDKPRMVPFEIQNGHNYMDIGWKNGVAADDPFDNWPLSKKWQWYDAILSLDEETTGTSGTGGASAEHGVWVYFMNKIKQGRYFTMYEGGPAVARMKLYEIDPEKNAPAINKPKDLPQRVLMVDWERQADQPPEDIVRYSKLMGYNAVSPIMLKWTFMNYGPPMNGYDTTNLDGLRYWIKHPYKGADDDAKPADDASAPSEPMPTAESSTEPADNDTAAETASGKSKPTVTKPGATLVTGLKPSVHEQYLAMTKKYGINYVPRIEYGGSQDLPLEARAIGGDGEIAKPDRFSTWGADLLNSATWTDLERTVNNYFKPFVQTNPQLTGMLWRIRCDRMQISYSRGDIELFAKETGTKLPDLSGKELALWASSQEMGDKYGEWWQKKRAQFHAKLVALLQSLRPDLVLYYYNWDADKFALGLRDMNTASTFVEVATARIGMVPEVYKRHVREQKKYTPKDYIEMTRTGQQTDWAGWGHDYGIHTELYKDIKGMEVFAPAPTLYLANCPEYLNYFQSSNGLAVSNAVSYDEGGRRSINPKYEGNMITPGGAAFSMAMELFAYFHGDARTLTYTVYTYGRGFADAHRRFAQAFLALPAIPGTVVDQGDGDVKVRSYSSPNGTYLGVAYKGYADKKFTVKIPGAKAGATVKNLVTNETVPTTAADNGLQFEVASGPMELNAYLVQ